MATAGSASCYAAWRGRLSPTMRQTHPAGERLFVDYAGQTVEVIDGATGEVTAGADLRGGAWRVQLHLRRGALDAGAAGLDRLPCRRVRQLRRCRAADRVRQPQGRRHRRLPIRAGDQPHLPGHGEPLRHGRSCRPACASRATRPRSRSPSRWCSAGYWPGCGTAGSSPWPN